jgi:hypothetical protein
MQQILSKCVATVSAMAFVVAASNAAQAHRGKWHHRWHYAESAAHLPYSYEYYPIYGYSLYGNCYLVEQFVPYRPYLVRVCPPR